MSIKMETFYRNQINRLLADRAAGKQVSGADLGNLEHSLAQEVEDNARAAQKEFAATEGRIAEETRKQTEAMHRRLAKEQTEEYRQRRAADERAEERRERAREAKEQEAEEARRAHHQVTNAVIESLAEAETLLESIQNDPDQEDVVSRYAFLCSLCTKIRRVFDTNVVDDSRALRDLIALEKATKALGKEQDFPNVFLLAGYCEELLQPYSKLLRGKLSQPIDDLPTLHHTSLSQVKKEMAAHARRVEDFKTLIRKTQERHEQALERALLGENESGNTTAHPVTAMLAKIHLGIEGLERANHELLRFFDFCKDEGRVSEAIRYYEERAAPWEQRYVDARNELLELLEHLHYYRPAAELLQKSASIEFSDLLTDPAVQARLQSNPPGGGDRLAVAAGIISAVLLVLAAVAFFTGHSALTWPCALGLIGSWGVSVIAKGVQNREGSKLLERARALIEQRWPNGKGPGIDCRVYHTLF